VTEGWEVPAGASHCFVLSPLLGFILEAEDLHFHFDSAVLLADYDPEAPAVYPLENLELELEISSDYQESMDLLSTRTQG